jgi:hypothetical protein
MSTMQLNPLSLSPSTKIGGKRNKSRKQQRKQGGKSRKQQRKQGGKSRNKSSRRV